MLANVSNLSTHSPSLLYTLLALYGGLTLVILTFVYAKFRTASRALRLLKIDWQNADSRHANLVEQAHEHMNQFSQLSKTAAPAASPAPVQTGAISFDLRNQVVVMAKKGFTSGGIARTCGLNEGEVEVLLGMARLQNRQEFPDGSILTYRQTS